MKLTATITFCLLCLAGIAQTSTNFTINKKLYEFKITKADDSHLQFSVAKALADTGGTQSFTKSSVVLKNIPAADFNSEFDKVMVQVDTTYNPGADTLKAEIDNVKTSLYSTLQASQKTATEQRLEVVETKLSALANGGADIRPIGYFTLKTLTPGTVTSKNATTATAIKGANLVTIKDVAIVLVTGSIAKRGLKVTLDDGSVFTNRDAPINLYNFAKETSDLLYEEDSRSTQYLVLGDVLRYSTIGRFYYPADRDDIHLNDKHRVDTINVATDINQLLDVSAYSDFLGLLGHKANGILQTEVSSNIVSNTATWGNSDIVVNNFWRPYIRLSKFDSRFGQLDSSKVMFGKNGQQDTINRTYLNQISYLQAGVKINFIRFGIGNNQKVYINGGADFNLVNADSLYKKDIGFINYYPEIEYSITWLKNWEFNMSGKVLYQYLTHDDPFANKKEEERILNFQAAISYYPFADPESKIYLRFSYYDNIKDGSYNFPQFQFGFKTSMFSQKKTIAK